MAKKAARKAPPARKSAATQRTSRAKRTEAEKTTADKTLSREKQIAHYDKAMQLFHSGDFVKAKAAFDTVIAGPNREVSHAARIHRNVCEGRLSKTELRFSTPEDRYNYAVSLINERQLADARKHLEQALGEDPNASHMHYALALCHALMGQVGEAARALGKSVELDPRTRSMARNDPDFQPFAGVPEIKKVLQPDAG